MCSGQAGIKSIQVTQNTHAPPAFVQAPSRLTTFRWCPMWLRILSSVIRALCSLAVAPSGGQKGVSVRQVVVGNSKIIYLWASSLPPSCSLGCYQSQTPWLVWLYRRLRGREVSLARRGDTKWGSNDKVQTAKLTSFPQLSYVAKERAVWTWDGDKGKASIWTQIPPWWWVLISSSQHRFHTPLPELISFSTDNTDTLSDEWNESLPIIVR